MRVTFERCAGLDVHKKTVVACVLTPEARETRTFGTMTADLLDLADWLSHHRISHVAMESTGIYWRPIYNLLEGLDFTLLVVNAQHIKAVPGRKTDVKDAEWIADLLRHGLLRGSFIPDRPQRELRDLVRYRRRLIQQRSRVVGRIEKALESANLKIGAVMSDVTGASGREMLEALAQGVEDPEVLAAMAKGTLRAKRADLVRAGRGLVGGHQRLMLQSLLRHLDFLEGEIALLDEEVRRRTAPLDELIRKLDAVPGIARRGAEDILAEIGTDMSRFPTAGHLASWAKVCAGNNESAGKQKSGSTGHANRWLRAALTQAAQAAARKRDSYFRAKYGRLAARRGKKRAIIALAHSILVVVYHLLSRPQDYRDLGPNYFDERDQEMIVKRSVRRIERLGYRVALEAI